MLELKVPNLVEPVTNSTLDVITWTFNCWAVIVPVVVISPFTVKDPDWVNDPVNEIESTFAENIVPVEPLIPNDPEIWTFCLNGFTYDAVKAYDELTAFEALIAKEAVNA